MSATNSSSVSLDLLRRFDRPGPRYTSYPTAVEFHAGIDQAAYRASLGEADSATDAAISLYVHLPFCRELCDFCACTAMATPHEHVRSRYLEYLDRELALVASELPNRRSLSQLHWGGGTPTYFAPAQIEALFASITRHFDIEATSQLALEADPRVTTDAHLETLRSLGFRRLSIGVQDFTPAVQQAIGRGQTLEQTSMLVAKARELGFDDGINFDLVYGLPKQDLDSFAENLDRVLELRPDRLAIYSFAFLPALKANQRRLDVATIPAAALKLELHEMAVNCLIGAGYQAIGMDHFSLATDELAVAASEGRLARNFMGYTVRPTSTNLGVGVSAIGDLAGGYFQNHRKLSAYYRALGGGRLPIERGRLLDADDELRRHVIMQLMCNFWLDKDDISRRFGIEFDSYFADSIARLGEFAAEGFLKNDASSLSVIGKGRLFVRNAAMVFDSYLNATPSRSRFSQTV